MKRPIKKEFENYAKNYKRRKSWQRVVSMLTCIIVFCTTYALILPAITLSGEATCGYEEHVHTDGCYEVLTEQSLTCSPVHKHAADCYEEGTLICGCADFVLHTHNDSCFSESGEMLCNLRKLEEHTHSEACYTVEETVTGHLHSDDCYSVELGEIVCGLEETEAHTHSEGCYGEATLSCTAEENDEHTHGEGCYTAELICGLEETEGHTHSDSCHEEIRTLICELEEDGVTTEEQVQICTKPEVTAHTHTENCYETRKDDNGEEYTVLICTELEVLEHQHSGECLESVTTQGALICAQQEHAHGLICYTDPTADLESAEIWERTMADVVLIGDAAADLLAIAESQLGYAESKSNYIVLEDGATLKGYTRYGQWNGAPYEDWNETFVAFCLQYAGIEKEDFPRAEENRTWLETLADAGLTEEKTYIPNPGNLIFLTVDDTDYVGVVSSVNEEGYVTAIIGDYENEVSKDTFTAGDPSIIAYAALRIDEAGELVGATDPTEETTESAEETTEPAEETTEPDPEDETDTGTDEEKLLRGDINLGMLSADSTSEEETEQSSISVELPKTYADAVLDLGECITAYNVYYRENGSGSWEKLTADVTVEKGTQLRFELKYVIPKGTLSAENNVVTYQLPLEHADINKDGDVIDGGKKVGTYTVDDNGLMTITYNPEFAEKNKSSNIDGTITFGAAVDSEDTDNDNKVTILGSDGQSHTITIKDEKTNYNDLTAEKAAEVVDAENGIIKYTVTVKFNSSDAAVSESGEISLSDWMGNNTYFTGTAGDVTYPGAKDSAGNDVAVVVDSNSANNFTLKLASLKSGETYTIVYYAKVSNASQGETKASNSVQVDSTNGDNKYHGEDYVESTIEFKDNPVNKTHTADADGNITWTITLDADKANGLNGWKLEDSMSGNVTTVAMSYNDSNGAYVTENITLPHTFDKEYTGVVTITYTMKASYVLGQNGIYNNAVLTPPQGEFAPSYSESDQYNYPNGTYNPVDKQLEGMDKDYAYLEWSLTISNNLAVVKAPWELKDTLSDNQYYTAEQKADIEAKIADMLAKIYGSGFADYELAFSGEYEDSDGTILGYREFKLTVNADLPVIPSGTSYSFTYRSTPDLGDETKELYFNNSVSFENVTDSAGAKYSPVLSKRDSGWSTGSTVLDNSQGNVKELVWYVELMITEEMVQAGKDLVITEDVPDDLTLTKLLLRHNFNVDIGTLESEGTFKIESYAAGYFYEVVKEEVNGDVKYKITFPYQTFVNNAGTPDQNIFFEIHMALPEDYIPSEYPDDDIHFMHDSFTNTVYVAYSGGEPFAEAEQTQTVTDPSITTGQDTESIDKIVKYIGSQDADKPNEIPYVLQINHDAADLDPESDWLDVTDILTYVNTNMKEGKIQGELVTSSVKISLYDANGNPYEFTVQENGQDVTRTYIDVPLSAFAGNEVSVSSLTLPGTYMPSSSTTLSQDGKQETVEHTVHFYVPDECFVKLEYTYSFSGYGQATMNNVAKVTSYGTEYAGGDQSNVKLEDAVVTATVGAINIQKVDAYNTAKPLEGAMYELYEYMQNSVTGNWEYEYVAILTSGEDGSLKIGGEDNENYALKLDTAYYLVEIKAPEKYVLDETRHYFLVLSGSVEGEIKIPSDFPENAYYQNNSTILITNEYSDRNLTVNKKWLTTEGIQFIPANTSIDIVLNQYLTYDNPDLEYSYGEIADVMLAVGTHSYSEEQYAYQNIKNTLGVDVLTGDIVTITYKNVPIDPASALSELPGLMNVTAESNYHIPYTAVANGDNTWNYVFKLKVRGDTNLRGWTYQEAGSGVTIDITRAEFSGTVAETLVSTQTVTFSGSDWSHTWTGLDKYYLDENGRILGYYRYELAEPVVPDGYVSDTTVNGSVTTITNKQIEKTAIEVEKQWADETKKEDQISFNLYRQTHDTLGTATVSFKVNGADSTTWTKTAEFLIGTELRLIVFGDKWEWRYAMLDGNLIASSSTEVDMDGDGNTDTDMSVFAFTVTGDHTIECGGNIRNVTDYVPFVGISRTVAGTLVGTYTLNDANSWSMILNDLPLEGMENGEHVYYSYYVEETNMPKYTTTYTVGGNTYSISPDVTDGLITITNTSIEGPTVNLEVEKAWQMPDGTATIAPADQAYVAFTLYQNNITYGTFKVYSGGSWKSPENASVTVSTTFDPAKLTVYDAFGNVVTTTVTGSGTSSGTVVFTATKDAEYHFVRTDGGSDAMNISYTVTGATDGTHTATVSPWKATLYDLPQKDSQGNDYSYTIVESPVEGYEASVSFANNTFTVVNKEVEKNTVEVAVDKKWLDANGNDISTTISNSYVNVILNQNYQYYGTYTIKASDNWHLVIPDLPKTYVDGNGVTNDYIYTVQEVSVAGYDSVVTGNGYEYVVTNNPIPETQIGVTKIWDDDNKDHTTDTINVQIYRFEQYANPGYPLFDGYVALAPWQNFIVDDTIHNNGGFDTSKFTAGASIAVYYTGTQGSVKLAIQDNVNWSWKEIAPASTAASGSGWVSTFSYDAFVEALGTNDLTKLARIYVVAGEAAIGIAKVDLNLSDDYVAPESGPLDFSKGTQVNIVTLSASNNWQETFANLPQYGFDSNGRKVYYTYAVKEDLPSGYVDSYSNTTTVTDGTINITNKWNLTSITVNKTWRDNGGHDSAAVSVTLYQVASDGTETEYGTYDVTKKDDGEWSLTIDNLPVSDREGNLYTYYVQEDTSKLPTDSNGELMYRPSYSKTENGSTVSSQTASDVQVGEDGVITVTNTAVTSIGVKKVWNLPEGVEETAVRVELWRYTSTEAATAFTVPMTADGEVDYQALLDNPNISHAESDYAYICADVTDGKYTTSYSKTFKNRPLYSFNEDGSIKEYYTYFIIEVADGYIKSYDQNSFITSGRIQITNSIETTSIGVNKVWNDGAGTPVDVTLWQVFVGNSGSEDDEDPTEDPTEPESTEPTTEHTHTWGGWSVQTPATCTSEGVQNRTCSGCGTTETAKIPVVDHDWDEGVITKNPTKTETGIKTYTCKVCGETKPVDIPATGGGSTEIVLWSGGYDFGSWYDGYKVDISSNSSLYSSGGFFTVYYTTDDSNNGLKIVFGWETVNATSHLALGEQSFTATYDYITNNPSNAIDWANVSLSGWGVTLTKITWTPASTLSANSISYVNQMLYSDGTSVSSNPLGGTFISTKQVTPGTTTWWTDLPKYKLDENGNILGEYTYYVVETGGDEYDATYAYGSVTGESQMSQGIASGTITITNRNEYHYELPATGGMGTEPYTLGGIFLLMAGCAVLLYNKKKGRKGAHTP